MLLVAWAVACGDEPPVLRRPWSTASDLTALTYDGTTMMGRVLTPGRREQTWVLGPAAAGEVWVAAAVDGPAGAGATLEITGVSSPEPCRVDGSPARWHPCRFALAGSVGELGLRVRLDGPEDARVAVSAPLVRSGAPSPRLVLVILMDTVRFDRLVTYEPRIPLGTALATLARDGVTFERAYSSSSWTRTAIATLFTGLDASTHGVLDRDDTLPPDLDTLPLAMQRAGYRTAAWSTNPNILPVWGFAAGFDAFRDLGALAWPKEKVPAATVLEAARAMLADGGPRPAFLYLHLMDPHGPYRPQPADLAAVRSDPALMATFPGETPTPAVREDYARYLAEIRGMDRELATFFAELRTQGAYQDAAILVLADHGEEFLDHGGIRHGKTLYEEVLRVPVILKLPGNALAGTRITRDVGLADLGPTLLGALGVSGLAGADGRDLWDRDHGRLRDEGAAQMAVLKLDTYHKAALVAERQKLILNYAAADQLFDLAADPGEQRNLLPGAGAVADQMRATLDTRIARHEAGWHVRVCGGDGSERQRLRIRVRGDARGALLETGDAVRLVDRRDTIADYEADFTLVPRPLERLEEGSLKKSFRPDEDDVLATAPDAPTLTVAAVAGPNLRYAVGAAQALSETKELSVNAADPTVRVRPSDAVDCRPQSANDTVPPGGRSSYLRVWYVPPAERLEEGQVAGELRERLRALGYQH